MRDGCQARRGCQGRLRRNVMWREKTRTRKSGFMRFVEYEMFDARDRGEGSCFNYVMIDGYQVARRLYLCASPSWSSSCSIGRRGGR